MRKLIIPMLASLALAGGCAGQAQYSGSGGVAVSSPDMVTVSPGVNVIADYDEPIFYSNGYYWWNVNGGWYRSSYYTGGWGYVSSPPVAVVRIGDPHRYRNYRPHNYVVQRRPVPSHRIKRPVVRDHRADRRPRR